MNGFLNYGIMTNMKPKPSIIDRVISVRARATIAAGAGLVAALVTGFCGFWRLAPLVAWDVTALVYITWILVTIMPLTAADTAALAAREDPSRAATDGILLAASVASLVAVGVLIFNAGHAEGAAKVLQVGLGVVSVVLSWGLVHTIFTLRYARLYYAEPVGGIDFNEDDLPTYPDFAYLSFTIGMTFQVSDTNLKAKPVRATALRHALLSYMFGTVIVATTINLLAGLSK